MTVNWPEPGTQVFDGEGNRIAEWEWGTWEGVRFVEDVLVRRRPFDWTFWTYVLLPLVFVLAPLGLTALCLIWRH